MNGNAPVNREKEIFDQALDLPSPEARAAFLKGACRDDAALLARLQGLLQSHAQSQFLREAPGNATTVVSLAAAESALEQPGAMIGRYKLLEALGEGGFGTVWLAEQKEPVRRRVALKVIKLGMDTKQVVARFEAERQALALMDHPNIAKVLDAGTTDSGRPYFVMELVRGIPITRFCDENKLSVPDRLDLFIKVCHAVQHAHQKGIIHRDLKPSNVLVTLHDGVPVPKVIDFGIAKATQQELTDKTIHTMFQQFIGTPAYVSPEQAEMSGLDIDTRSDIYSLGVLLYELLTGQTPFDGGKLLASGLDEMRRIIREVEPKRPSTRLSTLALADANALVKHRREKLPALIHAVCGDLDWIVMKCLEKDRTRRYETANGLAADVQRFQKQEPVVARPPSAAYRAQKWVRRNKLAFAATTAVSLALIGGVIASTWQAVRATRAERQARQAERSEAQLRVAADASRDNEKRARERADHNARELEESLYLNNMALAHWNLTREPPNIIDAKKLLESCKPELRGWEWSYLRRHWLDEPIALRAPGGPGINSVAFSSDDQFLAAAGADGNVTIWDVSARKALRSFPAHPNGYAFCVAFDPTDPTRLVSAGSDNWVKLWEWNAATLLHSWPIQYSFEWGMAYAVAFSPDGRRIAAGVGKGVVKVWSATTGEELTTARGQHEESPPTLFTMATVAFSPDGHRLATGGVDGMVWVWDSRSGKLIRRLGRPTNPIARVAFSKGDGERLIVADFDSMVTVWDVGSSNVLSRWRADSGRGLHGLAFSPDNQRIATGGFDRTVKLWEAKSGREVLTFKDFSKELRCVAFSHNGHLLAACGAEGMIRIWDATPRAAGEGDCLLTLTNTVSIAAMAVRKDGSWLACGGARLPDDQGGTAPLFIWDARSGKLLQTIQRKSFYLFSPGFSPDGRFLAVTGDDRDPMTGYTVEIHDLAGARPAFRTDPFPGDDVVFCLTYSPDGRHLLGGSLDGRILVWNAASGRTNCVLGQHDGSVFHLAFSPDGRYLASSAQTGQVKIWDGTRLGEPQPNPIELGTAVGDLSDTLSFSPDNRRLVIATDDRTATVWDVEKRTQVLSLQSESLHGFRAVAFSPDGRWIASGGTDCKVKLWDARTDEPTDTPAGTNRTGRLVHTFRGHEGEILRLQFLERPEGLRLLSGAYDRTIKYWDLKPYASAEPGATRTRDRHP